MLARRRLWTVLTVLVFALCSLSSPFGDDEGEHSSADDGEQHSDALHRRMGKTLQARSRRDGDGHEYEALSEPTSDFVAWLEPKPFEASPPAVARTRLRGEIGPAAGPRPWTPAKPRAPPLVS